MPEWLAILCMLAMYAMGFMTCGALFANGPFWNGVRSVYRFGRRP